MKLNTQNGKRKSKLQSSDCVVFVSFLGIFSKDSSIENTNVPFQAIHTIFWLNIDGGIFPLSLFAFASNVNKNMEN